LDIKPEHCKLFQEQIFETDKDLFSERELVLRDILKNNTRLDKAEAELEKTEDPVRREKLENNITLLRETIVTLEKRALALTPAQGNGSYCFISRLN
jgi:hypothetical protein